MGARTSSPISDNFFSNLIHGYQYENVPKSQLPSSWNIDRSNNAGDTSAKYEDGEIITRVGTPR